MRRDPHPISGAIYQELGDGVVLVEDAKTGKSGEFRWDGTWLSGSLTHADPHFLVFVGGPDKPRFSADGQAAAATDSSSAYTGRARQPPPAGVVARYVGDPGRETEQGMRSASHMDLAFFLENDRHPERIPDVYRLESPMTGGPKQIATARFHERRFHDQEVERIWKRTWQFACLEDDIPEVGDYHIYRIAHLSFLVVRTGTGEIKAHYNACLHRGRTLRDCDGRQARDFRCPFHGWSWGIDGALKEITCEWDFPGVRENVGMLPGAKVATWAGFVFINPDPDAEPLEDYLGPVMMAHYTKFRLENRHKDVHVQKIIECNWKVAQEAFMEGYHVIATHPQLMLIGPDSADIRYDVWGNWGRAHHACPPVSSPQRGMLKSHEEVLAQWRATADANAAYLRTVIGDEVDRYSDAELNDFTFNDLFPNTHPWGGWARHVFRFRPLGDDPDKCLMDVIYLSPWPEGREKPPAAPVHFLAADEPWSEAPELGDLGRILAQDTLNLPNVQLGLKTKQPPSIWYSAYQEGKIRNFHQNYERWMGLAGDE